MKKIIAVLGLASFVFAGPLAACGMDKDHADAKGSVEKQSTTKTDKADKQMKKNAKKQEASKSEKGRAKL